MCHGYKLANLNWCCQLLPCSDDEKSGSFMTNSWSFKLQPQKRAKQSHLHVCGDSWTFTCSSKTSTSSLQNGCVFESRNAWLHIRMLLSAGVMNIFHQRSRLSLPLKQGSNWQHQLRQASLYSRHIMTSALHHEQRRIFNELPFFVYLFLISIF